MLNADVKYIIYLRFYFEIQNSSGQYSIFS